MPNINSRLIFDRSAAVTLTTASGFIAVVGASYQSADPVARTGWIIAALAATFVCHTVLSRVRGRGIAAHLIGGIAFVIALSVVGANHVSFFLNSSLQSQDRHAAAVVAPVMPTNYATAAQLDPAILEAGRALRSARARNCVEPCTTVKNAINAAQQSVDDLIAQNGLSRSYDAAAVAFATSQSAARTDALTTVSESLGVNEKTIRVILGAGTAFALEVGAIAFWFFSAPVKRAAAPAEVVTAAPAEQVKTVPTAVVIDADHDDEHVTVTQSQTVTETVTATKTKRKSQRRAADPVASVAVEVVPDSLIEGDITDSIISIDLSDVERVVQAIEAERCSASVRAIRSYLGCSQQRAIDISRRIKALEAPPAAESSPTL